MEEKEKLIESIRAAFMGEQYPGDMDIVYDNTGFYLDVEEIKQKLIGKSWQEADKEFLFSERNDAPHFFSKAGFKYYIPAFMTAAVAYYDEMDDLPDALIGKFTFPEERDIAELEAAAKAGNALLPQFAAEPGDFFQRRLGGLAEEQRRFAEYMAEFNDAQCKVIRAFLEYMQRCYDRGDLYNNPAVAVERYWKDF
ncbi:MAG: hypothetical protein LBT26_02425 [Clostridiales Family XIII bacterium]|nr:hypothetical protein [Clostridiales Family XIII bacterium]